MTSSKSELPTADRWFVVSNVSPEISRITEPHAHPFVRGNIWHVRGTRRDLVVDSGLGVGSLRQAIPSLFAHDPVLAVTHAHLDHIGSAGEFVDRRWHPAERDHAPVKSSLRGHELGALLGLPPEDMPEILVDALPYEGYDLDAYTFSGAEPTIELADGDIIDIGDRSLSVLHCPGHTPGSIVLYEPSKYELFSGDVVYDGALLDQLHESNRDDYRSSMRRLLGLDVRIVYPGHGDPFVGNRYEELIHRYLESL